MKPLISLKKEDLLPKQNFLQGSHLLQDDLLGSLQLSKGVIHNLEEKMELRKTLSAPDLKERLLNAKKL